MTKIFPPQLILVLKLIQPDQQQVLSAFCKLHRQQYNWQVNNFSRPDKRKLMIYELLLRDFVAAHDWKTLRDTLNYLKGAWGKCDRDHAV